MSSEQADWKMEGDGGRGGRGGRRPYGGRGRGGRGGRGGGGPKTCYHCGQVSYSRCLRRRDGCHC